MKVRYAWVIVIPWIMACGTPGALQFRQLAPLPAPSVITARQLFDLADSTTTATAPSNADQIVILQSDSAMVAVSLYEFEDIFFLEAYVYNAANAAFMINASQFVLMDGSRLMFRRLEPHEAANIYLAEIRDVAPYQPKYVYDVQTATTGYIYSSGYYSADTQARVTRTEDPGYALGYAIGAAARRDRNRRFNNMAGMLYGVGFVDGSSVPGQTGGYGGIFWLKRREWAGPLTLRLADTGYEVQFRRLPSR